MLDPAHTDRVERRAAARTIVRRQRQLAALAVGGLIILVLLRSGAMASSTDLRLVQPPSAPQPAARTAVPAAGPATATGPSSLPLPSRTDSPLAPAAFGGLPALWAPHNVVGNEPGTAAAYAQASTLPGLPGYLLIADRGNNRIMVVTPQGQAVFLFPGPADLAGGRKLFYNDDTFVEPGGRTLIANEEDNNDIVQVGIASRSLRVLFGHPGQSGSDATHLNTPDDAYQLPDGSFTVADAYNCRILFIKDGAIVNQIGHTGACQHAPPAYLGAVNGDTPLPDGGVLVSEINGSWIDNISATGKLRFAVQAPVGYPSDPQPLPGGRILLADYSRPGHILIMDSGGRVIWRYGPGSGPGMLDHPSLAMGLPNGDIAVNDDYRNRIVIIDPRTSQIVWQYGHTDVGGTAPGYLHTPDGMDFIPAAPVASVSSPLAGAPDWAAVVHP